MTVNNILPMKFRVNLSVILLFLALFSCITAPACAALFTISSSGNGVFALQGTGLAGVGGIDATISYDTTTLANPRVVQGGLLSGATLVANTNSPGVVRIGVISTKDIAGSGLVATITFDRPGVGSGKILSLSTVTLNAIGAPLDAQSQVINPAEINPLPSVAETPPTDTSAASTQPPRSSAETAASTQPSRSSAETAASTSEQRFMGAGTITIPGETAEPPNQQPAQEIPQEQPVAKAKGEGPGENVAETVPERESPAAEPSAASPENKNIVYPSVLEHFREFKGEKTPKSLTALFAAAVIPGIRQEPAVVLTDGKTRVKVTIQSLSNGKETPNFALKGAKLISLKPVEDAWVIEALPDSKGYEAGITVLHNGSITEIPLTVAPPLDADRVPAGGLSEAGYNIFLKERGTDKVPRYDLNGDGVRTYLDDYIFTANFIVKRDSTAKAPPQK